ncbi:MAG: hypothetical protein M1822_009237 [Bathelium mastoideum]|nr:MAG: hypothetical protein M1822_009237 [Bathelium mastoideum]
MVPDTASHGSTSHLTDIEKISQGPKHYKIVVTEIPEAIVLEVANSASIILEIVQESPQKASHWSIGHMIRIVVIALVLVTGTTLALLSPTGTDNFIIPHFDPISSQYAPVSVAVFVIGLTSGPMAFEPLSEFAGRRLSLLLYLIIYHASAVGCAFSPSWPAFLVFRFGRGFSAEAALTVLSDNAAGSRNKHQTSFGPIIAGYGTTQD